MRDKTEFENAVAKELEPFIALYGLKKRFADHKPLRNSEDVAYDNGRLGIDISIDYDDRFLDVFICRADELEGTISYAPGNKPIDSYCRLWREVLSRFPDFRVPSTGIHALTRPGGLNQILAKVNEALILLGPDFYQRFD